MNNKEKINKEVDNNYKYFESIKSDLIEKHKDEFVLIKNKKIISFFKDADEAINYAKNNIEDGIYSIEELTNRTSNMGILENAVF